MLKLFKTLLTTFTVLTIIPLAFGESSWPQFRGPGGAGVSLKGDFPLRFGPKTNVVWKVALPSGHSSPCISGEKIFLTGFTDGTLETLCLSRRDGKVLWKRGVKPSKMEGGSRLSSPAASTTATEGTRLYVYFGSFGLLAYDLEGREQWRLPLPTPITGHGASTSPVVVGNRLVLACDQDVDSYVLAVDPANGKPVWKTPRPGCRRGFSTPLAWPPENPEMIILPGSLRLLAYSLKDGSERWSVRGLPNEMVSSPTTGAGLIFTAGWTYGSGVDEMPAFSGLLEQGDKNGDGKLTREESPDGPARRHFTYIDADKDGLITRAEWDSISKIFDEAENALLAVRPGGRGDVTETHIAWKKTRGLPYVPSPLYYKGRLYVVKNGGIVSCFDARTGANHFYQKRIGEVGNYYASPIAANDKICFISQKGVFVIIKASDELEILGRNELGEQVLATPAIIGTTLYVRSMNNLWAFTDEDATKTRPKRERLRSK